MQTLNTQSMKLRNYYSIHYMAFEKKVPNIF